MTREEAKEVFLNRGYVNGFFNGDKWRQSVVVISKWLEQEPCEDTISRQAVIKAVDAHTNEDGTLDDDISVILEDISSVNPIKQKKDPWIGNKPHAKDGFVVNCCSKY